MGKKIAISLIFVVMVFSGAYGDILYWSDFDLGTNPFPQAMTELGMSYTTATDAADFNTQLGAGSWDQAVLLIQGNGYTAGTFSNLQAYMAGGGKVIYTDWTMEATRGSWFGITYTGNYNMQPVTISDSFLQSGGVGSTVNLTNPGWGVWSMGMDLDGATSAATFDTNGDVAIAFMGPSIINGMLKDTFADAPQGLQLAKNELLYVPVPGAVLLGLLGLSAAGIKLRKHA